MAKEIKKLSDYQKINEDLIEVRVEIKSYKQSFKILVSSVAVIIAILAYFGYDKIESIQKQILNSANQRLAKTDSLLSNLDQQKLDLLNEKLIQKTKEYEKTLSNFNKALTRNKELESRLFSALPTNKRIESKISTYHVLSPEDYFEIKQLKNSFRSGEKFAAYLSFNDSFDLSLAKELKLTITQKKEGKRFMVKDYSFEVHDKLNKLSCTLNIEKGEYILEIGFIKEDSGEKYFYRYKKNISIK